MPAGAGRFLATHISKQKSRFEMKVSIGKTLVGIAMATALLMSAPASAVDAEAAETLARQENCLKCHAIDKKKSAPSYMQIAEKHKGEADAEARLLEHLRAGEIVKLNNGEEERHRVPKTKDEDALRNLIRWILSL